MVFKSLEIIKLSRFYPWTRLDFESSNCIVETTGAKRWQNNLKLVYTNDFTISFSLAIFKLQVVCTLNEAEGMQNKICLRRNSAFSVSGSYVGHVTTNFIFAGVRAVSPGGLINNAYYSFKIFPRF